MTRDRCEGLLESVASFGHALFKEPNVDASAPQIADILLACLGDAGWQCGQRVTDLRSDLAIAIRGGYDMMLEWFKAQFS